MSSDSTPRRVRAHELKEGDRVLVLDDRGERTPETIKSIQRDGRTFDVVYEDEDGEPMILAVKSELHGLRDALTGAPIHV